jgi:hypothetical protein
LYSNTLHHIDIGIFENFAQWIEKNSKPCFYKQHFGFECPGCGFQRAFTEILRGNIWESIKLYPALIPLFILILVLLFHLKFRFKFGSVFLKYWFLFTVGIVIVNYLYKLIIN